ncbi:MAG: hypothetical protein JWP50_939 [Phenylobacterium sp.]|nr:hypothetical protein [Phenylobacterium sp.]
MFYKPVDPARLSGDALDQWYRRTPDEIEAARQAAAQKRYNDFFGQNAAAQHGGLGESPAVGTMEPRRHSRPLPVRRTMHHGVQSKSRPRRLRLAALVARRAMAAAFRRLRLALPEINLPKLPPIVPPPWALPFPWSLAPGILASPTAGLQSRRRRIESNAKCRRRTTVTSVRANRPTPPSTYVAGAQRADTGIAIVPVKWVSRT